MPRRIVESAIQRVVTCYSECSKLSLSANSYKEKRVSPSPCGESSQTTDSLHLVELYYQEYSFINAHRHVRVELRVSNGVQN